MSWWDEMMTGLEGILGSPKLDTAAAGLGSVAALGSIPMGIYDFYQQQKQYKNAQDILNKPVDWQSYYQPMSDVQKRVMRNTLAGELAQRGLGDSMAGSMDISEQLAKTEVANMQKAMELANNYRGQSGWLLTGTNAMRPDLTKILGSIGNIFKPLQDLRAKNTLAARRTELENRYGNQPGITYDPRQYQWGQASTGLLPEQPSQYQSPGFGVGGLNTMQIPYGAPEGFYDEGDPARYQ